MIVLVEGPPGSGKTFSTCRRIVQSLDQGKLVATNVELHDDWAEVAASANFVRRLPGLRHLQADTAAKYRDRLLVSGNLAELFDTRLQPCGECKQCQAGRSCQKEGRGVMILDEAHNWMNARSWSAGGREDVVRWMSQHRKLGWDVYLISQRVENIDAQVRSLAEYRVYLRNLRKMRWHGIPLFPVQLFVAIWTWESIKGHVLKREAYLLNRIRGIYDSMALSHGLDLTPAEGRWLPHSFQPQDAATAGPPDARTDDAPDEAGATAPDSAAAAADTSDDCPPATTTARTPRGPTPKSVGSSVRTHPHNVTGGTARHIIERYRR